MKKITKKILLILATLIIIICVCVCVCVCVMRTCCRRVLRREQILTSHQAFELGFYYSIFLLIHECE
jgi:threonine/homoserine/homoserine lactone efflux protein